MLIPDLRPTLKRLSYMIPPAAMSKPARSLTQTEARDVFVFYVLSLRAKIEHPPTFTKDGTLATPKVGDKVRIRLGSIGGVTFTSDSTAARNWTYTGAMDLRMAVLAVRLSEFLKAGRWGVTTIYWGGMGVGRDPDDRHGKGYALDFHGAETNVGHIDVRDDWGNATITLPTLKPSKTWPAGTQPYFRLDVDTDAGGFFYDVYHFLTGEALDAAQPSSIGDRSFIVHPDHPDVGLRASHQDHIHCEIDH